MMKWMKYILFLIFAMWRMTPVLGIASGSIEPLPLDVNVIAPDGVCRSLSAYLTKPTILYVFREGSPPPQLDHPTWHTFHQKGIPCLAICLDPMEPMQDTTSPFTLFKAADSRLYEALHIEHLPLGVLFDRDGDVRSWGADPLALLDEAERILKTDIDESTWAKIKELFR